MSENGEIYTAGKNYTPLETQVHLADAKQLQGDDHQVLDKGRLYGLAWSAKIPACSEAKLKEHQYS